MDRTELYHYGVKGMKWRKHVMANTTRQASASSGGVSDEYKKELEYNSRTNKVVTSASNDPIGRDQETLNNLSKNRRRNRMLKTLDEKDKVSDEAHAKVVRQRKTSKMLNNLDAKDSVRSKKESKRTPSGRKSSEYLEELKYNSRRNR